MHCAAPAHPSIDSATASTPQGRRPRGRPPIPPSLIPTSKMPPSLAFLPNPNLDVLPGASASAVALAAEAESSRSSVSFHLFRQRFANKQNGPAIPFPRRRTDSSEAPLFVFAPTAAPWHCSWPVCGASYVHIIIREALVFGFARWMDGRMEWMNVEEGRSSAEPEAKITRRNGKSSGIGVGKRWSLTVICHVCPCYAPPSLRRISVSSWELGQPT